MFDSRAAEDCAVAGSAALTTPRSTEAYAVKWRESLAYTPVVAIGADGGHEALAKSPRNNGVAPVEETGATYD